MSSSSAAGKTVFSDEKADDARKATGGHYWENFGLKDTILKGIYEHGFEKPSYIQKKSISHITSGQNLLAQAQSGTGKTGAFVIGALQAIDENNRQPQCIVLSSTREIAVQNATLFQKIGAYMGITVARLAGGTGVREDRDLLRSGVQVVVGTPGRVRHMVVDGYLNTSNVKLFILDEADELLRPDFQEQVQDIYLRLPPNPQVLFFSATYGEAELAVVNQIVQKYEVIDLRQDEQTLQGILQFYVDIGSVAGRGYSGADAQGMELEVKVNTLLDIMKNQVVAQMIIFINERRAAANVADLLRQKNHACSLITADFTQQEREQTLQEFKSGASRILVSSGLCKRGIDVQALSLVVCFDVPSQDQKNDYIHRVGRSGRYGRKGIALHILNSQELEGLKAIAAHFHSDIKPLPADLIFQA